MVVNVDAKRLVDGCGLPMMQSEIVVGYPEMAEPFYGKRAIAQ
jgi:hypothetical protein